ncbi:MAG: quinone-dependent dihydroorotate dehydrogenase [Oligoflexia bacterium]
MSWLSFPEPLNYSLLRRALFVLDAEKAHHLACTLLRWAGPLVRGWSPEPQDRFECMGLNFRSRLGLAAGFDKNGQLIEAIAALGFGFMEIGTVTPRPQAGNPRPRLFRDPLRRSLWNRMGFNNEGAPAVAARLKRARESGYIPDGFQIGVNLGKNRDTPIEHAAQDYLEGFKAFEGLADFFVINVSSPNTPGLRDLQDTSFLLPLLAQIRGPVPCLLKIAPELSETAIRDLVGVLDPVIDGWVVSNTLKGAGPGEAASLEGGWSGEVLRSHSFRALTQVADLAERPIVSVGGIASAEEACLRVRAKASLLQVYTGWIYEGPGLVRQITEGIRPGV